MIKKLYLKFYIFILQRILKIITFINIKRQIFDLIYKGKKNNIQGFIDFSSYKKTKKYKHKKCDLIISAEKFKEGMEDKVVYDKYYKFLSFSFERKLYKKIYYVLVTCPTLDWIRVNKNDMIVIKENEDRVFKMVYPKKNFKRLFKEIKE